MSKGRKERRRRRRRWRRWWSSRDVTGIMKRNDDVMGRSDAFVRKEKCTSWKNNWPNYSLVDGIATSLSGRLLSIHLFITLRFYSIVFQALSTHGCISFLFVSFFWSLLKKISLDNYIISGLDYTLVCLLLYPSHCSHINVSLFIYLLIVKVRSS